MRPTGPETRSSKGTTNRLLSGAVVVILILSAYMAIQVSGLQGEVSSLQTQNAILQDQLVNMQQAQNFMLSQLSRLVSTSAQSNVLSFYAQDVCVAVLPVCYTYPGHQGSYVYAMTLVNNGTVAIPITTSVDLQFKDATRSTLIEFNSSLPQAILPGAWVSLNSTFWPANTNATSKLSPGDDVGFAVFLGEAEFGTQVHVAVCSSTVTTFQNYTSTQTETQSSCTY